MSAILNINTLVLYILILASFIDLIMIFVSNTITKSPRHGSNCHHNPQFKSTIPPHLHAKNLWTDSFACIFATFAFISFSKYSNTWNFHWQFSYVYLRCPGKFNNIYKENTFPQANNTVCLLKKKNINWVEAIGS